jgi:hypothetical protein
MVIIGFSALGCLLKAKVYRATPQVCTINVLEIMFGTRAYIEIISSVPFFKSYPVAEVVSAKLQQAIEHVISVHIQKDGHF